MSELESSEFMTCGFNKGVVINGTILSNKVEPQSSFCSIIHESRRGSTLFWEDNPNTTGDFKTFPGISLHVLVPVYCQNDDG